MILIIIILVLGAIILGGVILYNLGVLSYLERYYEFSTLKVLGFKDTQIQKILVQQNIWLSMIGILLGLPVGYLLIEYMISTIQDTMDVINFIALPSYLYAILGTLVISWVISK
ncbi:MAG: FtsX-like permease family protein, partial [Faecalibacillus sp.]